MKIFHALGFMFSGFMVGIIVAYLIVLTIIP